MIKKGLFILGLTGLTLSSCIEHEVIPAPEPKVDLVCSFEGNIGGQFVEYTENVDGYYGYPSIAKQTVSLVTDAQYFFAMVSDDFTPFVKIGMGSITWNSGNGSETPSLSLFNGFFAANDLPDYSDQAFDGFEVSYHHINGSTWTSLVKPWHEATNTANGPKVAFTGIKQESDASGDYSQFVCTFDNVWLYYTDPITSDTDSLIITEAIYRGWFKR
jgi:hypothetical protein